MARLSVFTKLTIASLFAILFVVVACHNASQIQSFGSGEVGANPGQPFGPATGDMACSNWQNASVCKIQNIPVAFVADAAIQGSTVIVNDAGQLTIGISSQPGLDGGFPSATEGQFFVQGASGPIGATVTGDLTCSTSTPAKCTLTAINGVPYDAGAAANTYVLTFSEAGVYWSAPAVANYGRDLAVCDGGQCVVAIDNVDGGTGQTPVTSGGLDFGANVPNPTISQDTAPSATSVPISIHVRPQGPNASAATTSTGTPGSLYTDCKTELSTGYGCGDYVTRNGTTVSFLGPIAGSSGNLSGWCGVESQPCTLNNVNVSADNSGNLVLAAPTSIWFQTPGYDGTVLGNINSSRLRLLEGIEISSAANNSGIALAPQPSDTTTHSFSFVGQSAYGSAVTNTAGGPAYVCGGNNTSSGGAGGGLGVGYTGTEPGATCSDLVVSWNASDVVVNPTGEVLLAVNGTSQLTCEGSFVSLNAGSDLQLQVGESSALDLQSGTATLGESTLQFGASVTNPTITQATTSGTGHTLEIIGQESTGSMGGGVNIAAGTGTSTGSEVVIGSEGFGAVLAQTDSKEFKWVTRAGIRNAVAFTSISSSIGASQHIIDVTANSTTQTLPSGPIVGDTYTVCLTDAPPSDIPISVTISAGSGQTINNYSSVTLSVSLTIENKCLTMAAVSSSAYITTSIFNATGGNAF